MSTATPSSNIHVSAGFEVLLGVVGVFGTHILCDDRYVADMGHRNLSRIRIDPQGSLAASAESCILETSASDTYQDDVALDELGNVYLITSGGDTTV